MPITLAHRLQSPQPRLTGSLSKIAGRRILVVEDIFLVAADIADQLRDFGCHVSGPVGSLKGAILQASYERLDGALLDINLGGETSFPAADVLMRRGIPFAFITAYAQSVIPQAYKDVPLLNKPLERDPLLNLIASTFVNGT